jgi:hypothetical protein
MNWLDYLRRWLRVIAAAMGSLVIVGGALFTVLWAKLQDPCDRVETALSRDGQGRAVMYVNACEQEWVDLVSPNGRRVRLLTFSPWGGEITHNGMPVKGPFEPSATWKSANELRISIGTVGSVEERRTEANGVHVTYDIGLMLYK